MARTRRQFLQETLVLGMMAAGIPGQVYAQNENKRKSLTVYGPPAGPSIPLTHTIETNPVSGLIENLHFNLYRNPDVLRANFVSGKWELAAAPSYVAANLYNRGLDVRLMNVITWGLLYVISSEEYISSFEDLQGETLCMPYKGDMPDLTFQHIASEKGMISGQDYHLQHTGSPMEAVKMLLSGRVKHAVLPEPMATAAFCKARKLGRKVFRAINIQQAWAEVTGGPARIPQTGLLIADSLLDDIPDFATHFHAGLERSANWVVSHPAEASQLSSNYMPVKASVINKSIPFSDIKVMKARQVQDELEQFYSILAQSNPAIIGGKLPDEKFYLD